ncbi:hypothetical protein GTU73_10365 [Rathayibacter sp. VKM Ac-2804]|uniref:hypothetical protein n=1 Tax=Rathayibacter sp. VKM Ac-2804 TaxID=2609257 RepID=UPI00132F2447|nr:hypothetical protein [Rathayibacter sp. VKM Ac-2804]QHF24370.1 hypothetical protein GTU73_10365 [Rathayibacter sp. VKM Ac-2804]
MITVDDAPYAARLVADARVRGDEFVARSRQPLTGLGPRPTMRAITSLVALAVAEGCDGPESRVAAAAYLQHLEAQQLGSGLFSSSGNLASPPDTAFTINDLCGCLELLDRYRPAGFDAVRDGLAAIAVAASPAMLAGGVHTPNHRWELASALAALAVHVHGGRSAGGASGALAAALLDRADAWLAEGVDIDADGQYSERSAVYATEVTNPSLLTLAHDLDRPALLEPVRRNLRAIAGLVEDDGEIECVHSRRQDQTIPYDVENLLSPYRLLAIEDGDADAARIVGQILGRALREPERHLAELLRRPEIGGLLPAPAPIPGSVTRSYPVSRLLRRREGALSASVSAGSDFASTGRIGSGLANSATLVRARAHGLVLRSLRVSPAFFSLGCARPQTLEQTERGGVLVERRVSGYYDTLGADAPAVTAVPDSEGRFFSVMDFTRRERFEVELRTEVAVEVDETGLDVRVSFTGLQTRYALELVVDGDALVEGAAALEDGWWLDGATATVATDSAVLSIETEPGDGVPPVFDDGEMFTYVGGADRVAGTRILLGGSTTQPRRLRLAIAPR